MPCFHPWKLPVYDRNGRRYTDVPDRTLPCRQCIGCRMDHSRDWATRIYHESTLHEENSFLTLTYADEHLPEDYSVSSREMQLFMKRLRKQLDPKRVRFFLCGEYGGKTLRPHYHVILFGHQWHDTYPWRRTSSGHVTYRSPKLEEIWTLGTCEIGSVTLQSAGYVARYMLKKVGGDRAGAYYRRIHPLTGCECLVNPEFIRMSTKPGLGSAWYDRFSTDCFPSDFVTVDGVKRPIPRYYTKKLKGDDALPMIKARRMQNAAEHADNNTPERLAVREESQHLKTARLVRDLEDSE